MQVDWHLNLNFSIFKPSNIKKSQKFVTKKFSTKLFHPYWKIFFSLLFTHFTILLIPIHLKLSTTAQFSGYQKEKWESERREIKLMNERRKLIQRARKKQFNVVKAFNEKKQKRLFPPFFWRFKVLNVMENWGF